ncbi:MAG TPA: carboxypeptidase regulatory-like domain-containing protein [Bryobacteraceae bacterium]|nr:carboxypeptidase regulatory-like domain-containing protein [Bryobacteraceae bacterium]
MHVRFEVTEPFIGMEGRGKEVEVVTGVWDGDCGFRFDRGQSYVVYAGESEDGQLATGICSRTAELDRAQDDLAYLRSLVNGKAPTYVYGDVLDGEIPGRFDEALGAMVYTELSGATVTLTGQATRRRLITGPDGSFRFDGLAPGRYTVAVSKDGYSARGHPPDLDVHAGGCAVARRGLAVDRRIAGRVTGADGLPAAHVKVEMVAARPANKDLPFPVAETQTAADGTYEIPIWPGEFYLGINLLQTPSDEMPYARFFYPGTEDPSRAGIVVVKQESGTASYNFPIPAPQKRRRAEGFVYWPDGRAAAEAEIRLEDVRWPWQTVVIETTTDARGHFEIQVFDGTIFRVHATKEIAGESTSAEPFPLGPATDVSKPLRLVLTRRGNSADDLRESGLERWWAGQGF